MHDAVILRHHMHGAVIVRHHMHDAYILRHHMHDADMLRHHMHDARGYCKTSRQRDNNAVVSLSSACRAVSLVYRVYGA